MNLIFLGATNPYPGKALYPYPPGCTGWRLWKMTGLSRKNYLKIKRHNWFDEDVVIPKGSTVVVLGEEVRRRLGIPKILVDPVTVCGITYRYIPHPSGLCRFYNDPKNKAQVEEMLRKLCQMKLQESSQRGRRPTDLSARSQPSPKPRRKSGRATPDGSV